MSQSASRAAEGFPELMAPACGHICPRLCLAGSLSSLCPAGRSPARVRPHTLRILPQSPPTSHQLHRALALPDHRAVECWVGGVAVSVFSKLPLLPLQLLIPCLSMHCIVCKVLPHLPFHLTPKAVLGAGQGGDNTPFCRRGEGSSKKQAALFRVTCSARRWLRQKVGWSRPVPPHGTASPLSGVKTLGEQ